MKKIIGIDIGGTKISVVLAVNHGDDIEFLDKAVFLTKVCDGFDNTIENLFKHIDEIAERNHIDFRDVTIGISCGGPLDSQKGLILSPPNLVGWKNVNIVEIMRQRYGIEVFLQNDANAGVLAEWLWGAGRGHENVVFLTFGTGLGAGLILGGQLYLGSNGMAGEVGHIRLERMGPTGYGKSGSFEGFCSGNGISQLAKSMVLQKLQMGETVDFCPDINQLEKITAERLFKAAKKGDPDAIEIVKVCGKYLGKGLSILIDVLNPQVIILGTIFVHNHDILYPSMKAAINEEAIRKSSGVCEIMPAALGSQLGDYASVTTAIYGAREAGKC